jgi:hypothetical protein
MMTFWGLRSGFTVVLPAPPIPPTADAMDTADFSCVTPLTGAGSILVGDFTTFEAGITVIFAGDFTGDDMSLFTIILCNNTYKQLIQNVEDTVPCSLTV